LFGHDAEEIESMRRQGYRPRDYCEFDDELAAVVDLLRSGFFSRGDPALFAPLLDGLLNYDPYFVLADFAAYARSQERVAQVYGDRDEWTRMSVLNCMRS